MSVYGAMRGPGDPAAAGSGGLRLGDDADDQILEQLHLVVAHDGLQMGIAHAGIIGEENVAAIGADGESPAEELGLPVGVGGHHGDQPDALLRRGADGSLQRCLLALVGRRVEDQKGQLDGILVPFALILQTLGEDLGHGLGGVAAPVGVLGVAPKPPYQGGTAVGVVVIVYETAEVVRAPALQQRLENELASEQQKFLQAFQDSLDNYLKAYNKAKKYDMIVNKAAVLYADKRFDITSEVVKGMNNRYKKGSASSTEKSK